MVLRESNYNHIIVLIIMIVTTLDTYHLNRPGVSMPVLHVQCGLVCSACPVVELMTCVVHFLTSVCTAEATSMRGLPDYMLYSSFR